MGEVEKLVWGRYVAHVAHPLTTGSAIAREMTKRGLPVAQPTVSRWLAGTHMPTEAASVAAFARTFDRNVLEAFVAGGMLTLKEAQQGLDETSVKFLKQLRKKPYSTSLPINTRRPRKSSDRLV